MVTRCAYSLWVSDCLSMLCLSLSLCLWDEMTRCGQGMWVVRGVLGLQGIWHNALQALQGPVVF